MRTWLVGFLCVGAVVAAPACGSGGSGDDKSGGTATGAKPPQYVPVQTEYDDLAVAPSCDLDDAAQNCLEVSPNAVRLDDELRMQFVAGGDRDPDKEGIQLELAPGATLDPRIKEGAVVYRSRKDRKPLLHRVDALKVDGSKVSLKLSRANAREAFPRGRVRTRIPLGPEVEGGPIKPKALWPQTGAESLGVVREPLTLSIGPKDCSGVKIDNDHVSFLGQDIGSVNLNLTECRFVLSAWVDATLIWDHGIANVDQFEITVGGSVDAALHAKLTANVSALAGSEVKIFSTPDIPISIGGFLITITPSINAGWVLTGKANLTAEAGFDYTGSIEEGFGYSDTRDWYSIDNRTQTFSAYGPTVTFDGSITGSVYLKPRVDIQAYGIVGGYVALTTSATATVTSTGKVVNGKPTGDVCASLSASISPSVGGSADILGIKLFDEEVTLATWTKSLVSNACVPYLGAPPSDCDASSDCCVDGECTAGENTTVTCEPNMPLGNGKNRYHCVTHFPEGYCLSDTSCDDNRYLTDDACIGHACSNTLREAFTQATSQTKTITRNVTCNPPACCHENADCADGIRTTTDICENGTPSEAGTCKNTVAGTEPGVLSSKTVTLGH